MFLRRFSYVALLTFPLVGLATETPCPPGPDDAAQHKFSEVVRDEPLDTAFKYFPLEYKGLKIRQVHLWLYEKATGELVAQSFLSVLPVPEELSEKENSYPEGAVFIDFDSAYKAIVVYEYDDRACGQGYLVSYET